jgi:hypothetical protein
MAMTVIDAAALDAAETFVLLNARLLDRRRFAHQFRDGAGGAVVAALAPYANADGGFGHALEPDLRGAASQPEPVSFALRTLFEAELTDDADIGRREAMVVAAVDFLASIATADGGVPWVLPTVRSAPRAPWWQPADPLVGSLVPTASIAGTLSAQGVAHPWLADADRFCRARIDAITAGGVDLEPYGALAILRFLDGVRDRDWADEAFTGLREPILDVVTIDPDAPGHVHLPLEFAPTPDGFGRRLFDDEVIERHLDLLVDAQGDDGGWGFNWEPWADVTVAEWRGSITVDNLMTLRAHGRWPA